MNFFVKRWHKKTLSKAVSNKLKTVLPILISSQQTAYVKNRFIGESGRLIFDIIQISNWFDITGFLVTMDIEKTFWFSWPYLSYFRLEKVLVLEKNLLPG